jgi:hypothetical protein
MASPFGYFCTCVVSSIGMAIPDLGIHVPGFAVCEVVHVPV